MNYATIKLHDVANGPGVRVSLFVSGCPHRCPGCFNAEAWDFAYGSPFTEEVADRLIDALAPTYIKGFSLLGGEPFAPENRSTLAPLLERIKAAYPQKTVWCYTGYELDRELLGKEKDDRVPRMLSCIDVLVDGRFIQEQKDLNLRFRGSANQRIIDLPRTLREGRITLHPDYQ